MFMFQRKFCFLAIASLLLSLGLGPRLVSGADEEVLGQTGEKAGKFREALTHYAAALQSVTEGSADDQRLREKIIQVAQKLDPPPAVPKEAERFMARGHAALEEAKGPEDFQGAVNEFKQALTQAPWWADAYYNLGLSQEKLGDYDRAIANLKLYLLAAPNAPDAKSIENQIYKLEYKKEKDEKDKQAAFQAEQKKQSDLANLAGTWHRKDPGWITTHEYTVTVDGNQVKIVWNTDTMGKHWYEGTISGDQISGTFYVDWTGWRGGSVFSFPFHGTINAERNKIRLWHTNTNISGAKGLTPTGWRTFNEDFELKR